MTVTTLASVVAGIQGVLETVSGVRAAPDIPPEQWGPGVYALVYPATGTFEEMTEGRVQGDHTLHVLVCTPRVNLRTDWAAVIALGDSVPLALIDEGTLSGAILGTNQIRYSFGEFEWGGQTLLGWRFEVDVSLTGGI